MLVQFNAGAFDQGNVFSIILSDTAGQFDSTSAVIGQLAGSGNGVVRIWCNLPRQILPYSGYRFRVSSSSPAINSLSNMYSMNVSESEVPDSARQHQFGLGKWKANVYSWYSPVDVTQQVAPTVNFFDSARCVSNFDVNTLSFTLEMGDRGISETVSGVTALQGCNKTEYYAIRLLRRQYFDSGYYSFRIRGDDGVRFSTDGGTTWLVSSWTRQSNVSTCHNNCCGVYMSAGVKDLVFEFFEERGSAVAELIIERSGRPGQITPPNNLINANICASVAPFQVGFVPAGGRYSGPGIDENGIVMPDSGGIGPRTIQYSTGIFGCRQNSSVTFNVLPRPQAPVIEAGTPATVCEGEYVNLISNLTQNLQWFINGDSLSGNQDSLIIVANSGTYTATSTSNTGCTSFPSNAVEVNIVPFPQLLTQPSNVAIVPNENAVFTVEVAGDDYAYQWQIDSTGSGFIDLAESSYFVGTDSSVLTLVAVSVAENGYAFRCVIGRNQCNDTTQAAQLSILTGLNKETRNIQAALYPNPGTEAVQLKTNSKLSGQLSIFNALGTRVLSTGSHEILNVKKLPKGVYYWKFQAEGFSQSGVWVKE